MLWMQVYEVSPIRSSVQLKAGLSAPLDAVYPQLAATNT